MSWDRSVEPSPGWPSPGGGAAYPPRQTSGGLAAPPVPPDAGPPTPRHRRRRRRLRPVVLVAVVVAAGAAGAAIALVAADGAGRSATDGAGPSDTDGASTASPVTAPDGDPSALEAVMGFYDAMATGDCDAVDAMTTDAVQHHEVTGTEEGCAEVARWIAEHPDDVAEVLPQIKAVQVRLETSDLAVVDVTFDVSGPADRTVRRFLLRPEGAGWLFATADEAAGHRPVGAGGELDGDVIVWLDAGITEEQRAAVEGRLREKSEVLAFDYLDHRASLDEARRVFEGNEVMLRRIAEEPEVVPTSFRLVLLNPDWTTIQALVDELAALPGVHESMRVDDRSAALPA